MQIEGRKVIINNQIGEDTFDSPPVGLADCLCLYAGGITSGDFGIGLAQSSLNKQAFGEQLRRHCPFCTQALLPPVFFLPRILELRPLY
jgi:hypothetical protein